MSVFQVRPQNLKKEPAWAECWAEKLLIGQKPGKRTVNQALSKQLLSLCAVAFPGDSLSTSPSGLSRPSFPAASMEKIPPHALGAEILWAHAERVILQGKPHNWKGLHQVIRIFLQALDKVMFPADFATQRSQVDVGTMRTALQGMSALLYVVARGKSDRAQVTLALLPHEERRGLLNPLEKRSEKWRKGVRTFIDRQGQAVRGGAGFDEEQLRAIVYVEDSGGHPYIGFAREWRANNQRKAGYVVRDGEHGEARARAGKHRKGKQSKYMAWRRSAAGAHTSCCVRREQTLVASEMEQQAITRMAFTANKMRRKGRRRNKPRGRAPPWKAGADRRMNQENLKRLKDRSWTVPSSPKRPERTMERTMGDQNEEERERREERREKRLHDKDERR